MYGSLKLVKVIQQKGVKKNNQIKLMLGMLM